MKQRIKNFIFTVITTVITVLVLAFVVINYVPLSLFEYITVKQEEMFGGVSLTTILSTDKISSLPTTLNANFTALDDGKIDSATSTMESLTSAPNLATVGTIVTGTWTGDTVTIANGGTSAVSFTNNTLFYGNGTSAWTDVATGTAGQLLTIVSGQPAWQSASFDTTADYHFTGDNNFTGSVFISALNASTTGITIGGNNWTPRFGGDGAEGALDTSGGTVDIVLGGNRYVEKNYTSINIVTNALTFSGAHASGTVVVLRSQGDVTITDTITANFGGVGGASVAGAGVDGNDGKANDDILDTLVHSGGGGKAAGTAGFAGAIFKTTGLAIPYTTSTSTLHRRGIMITSGSGGGSGASSNTTSGAGGIGGGGLFIETSGSLNFTGTINMDGADGGNGAGGAGLPSGGGGGGGSTIIGGLSIV